MATVIDSLVVELGLDPKKFNQGQREAVAEFKRTQEEVTKRGKLVESDGKRVTDVFGALKRQAVGLLGAFFAGRGIQETVKYITTLDANVGRLAKTLPLSTEELARFRKVAELTGGDANAITGSIAGLTDQLQRFLTFGEASHALPLLNQLGIDPYSNGQVKNMTQLILELSSALEGRNKVEARSILQQLGFDQSGINFILKGRAEVERLLGDVDKLGLTTQKSADEAQRLETAWTRATTALTNFFRVVAQGSGAEKLLDLTTRMFQRLSRDFEKTGWFYTDQTPAPAPARPPAAPPPAAPKTGQMSKAEMEQYIRAAAVKRGIDPNVALAVARSEGLNNYFGDLDATGKPTSFGPFQLHYAGVGRHTASGLGTKFTASTGLDARDPNTVRQQIDFALDEARRGGWGPWHGWKGVPWAGINRNSPPGFEQPAASTSSQTSTVTIGTINVNAPNAKNADEISREIGESLRRNSVANSLNYGQQ